MLSARLRLTPTSLLVLSLSASPILLTSCLEVGAVVLIVAKLVAVVTIYLPEVPPRRLYVVTPSPVIPLDESELERARLSV